MPVDPQSDPKGRLLSHVQFTAYGCYEWTAQLNNRGRPCFWLNRRNVYAYRAAYMLFVGPIPKGMEIDHLCKNPTCVNPCHLEAVTVQENHRRQRYHWAERTHCEAGHLFDEGNTYWRKGGGRECRACRNKRTLANHYRRKKERP